MILKSVVCFFAVTSGVAANPLRSRHSHDRKASVRIDASDIDPHGAGLRFDYLPKSLHCSGEYSPYSSPSADAIGQKELSRIGVAVRNLDVVEGVSSDFGQVPYVLRDFGRGYNGKTMAIVCNNGTYFTPFTGMLTRISFLSNATDPQKGKCLFAIFARRKIFDDWSHSSINFRVANNNHPRLWIFGCTEKMNNLNDIASRKSGSDQSDTVPSAIKWGMFVILTCFLIANLQYAGR